MPPISDRQRAARIKAVQEHFHIENTHDLDAVMDTFGTTCSFLANMNSTRGGMLCEPSTVSFSAASLTYGLTSRVYMSGKKQSQWKWC